MDKVPNTPNARAATRLFNAMMKIDRECGLLERQISNAIDYRATAVANRARRMIASRHARRAELAAQWNTLRGAR